MTVDKNSLDIYSIDICPESQVHLIQWVKMERNTTVLLGIFLKWQLISFSTNCQLVQKC